MAKTSIKGQKQSSKVKYLLSSLWLSQKSHSVTGELLRAYKLSGPSHRLRLMDSTGASMTKSQEPQSFTFDTVSPFD